MQAHQLRPPAGSTHAKKRVGRGNSSGQGTYSGKGLKGQKARAGAKPRRFFEGGQTELMRRLPRKRGFTNHFRIEFHAINLRDLAAFEDGAEVTPETLKEAGIISSLRRPVKILAMGEVTAKLTVRVHKLSMTAKEKIEAAGGSAESTLEPKRKRQRKIKRSKKGGAPKAEAEEPAAEDKPAEKPEEEAKGDGDSE